MDRNEAVEKARPGFAAIKVAPELKEKAAENLGRWLAGEQYREARPQLEYLIETENFNGLFDAFFRQMPFGTGGRRGPVGFGTNRFNQFTLSTSIQGHARFLRERFGGARRLAAVVAYDVRVFRDLRGVYDADRPNPLLGMSSKEFAKIAAGVYAANGIEVWMPDPASDVYLSTPELSFAIRRLGACGGLNVSASHNHPDDNGAKIYNDHGSQEIPPADEELATIVEATASADSMPFEAAVAAGHVKWIPAEVHEAYLEMNRGVSRTPGKRSARIVFTPLHGTGFHSAGAALERAGFKVELYGEQGKPDGTFPNVPFRSPNPEVPQSLQGAKEYAARRGADIVLGTDPDADRLGMMAPHAGEWVFFNGNEIGVILMHYLLSGGGVRGRQQGRPFAVTTVVTTSLFARIARARGVQVVDDLGVGFKYIAHVMNTIESSGRYEQVTANIDDFLIAIEESHGYLVAADVRDKDAAGAAVLLAEIASILRDEGRSFVDYADDIYREFGYVRNFLVSTVMQGARGFVMMRKIQDSLRERPAAEVGGRKVLEVSDRWDEAGRWGKFVSETDRMSRDLITFSLEGDARITLRPSGTESKNKIYVEVAGKPIGKTAGREALAAEKARLDREARGLGRAFTREMLSRIEVELPEYALAVSDLVPLECKQDFAEKFLPELEKRLGGGQDDAALRTWIETRLKAYGADGPLLVKDAVEEYLGQAKIPAPARAAMAKIFGLTA